MKFQRRQIEMLVALADTGSMHKAAQQLGIAQPAVSRLLAGMEQSIGGRLFERTSVGSALTPRGASLAAQARWVLSGLNRMDHIGDQAAPVIRFGCIPRAMQTLMPFLLENLGAQGQLQVTEDGSPALFAAMQHAQLDFAVMRHVAGVAGMVDRLVARPLYDERPAVIRKAQRSFSRKKIHSFEELSSSSWVLPAPGTTTRTLLEKFWQEVGVTPIRPVIETRSYESSVAIVSSTDLLSIIPHSIARWYERLGLVKVVDVTPALPPTAVLLVCEEHALSDPVLSDVLDLVLRAAASARKVYALGDQVMTAG